MGLLWDQNWQCLETDENLLVFYEEDTEGDLFIDQNIEFFDGTHDYSLDVDIKIQNRAKDEVIIMQKLQSTPFFVRQNLPNACVSWIGLGGFNDRSWPVYDCGSDEPFTIYHRWINVQDNSNH